MPDLQKYIEQFTILIDCPPEVVLLTLNLHEDFVDIEGIAVALVPAFQAPGISLAKLDAEPAP